MSLFGSLRDFAKGTKHERDVSVLGIDIGSSSIKVVELTPGETADDVVLSTYGSIALGPYLKKSAGESLKVPPEIVARALETILSEAKATSRNAGVAIPFSASLATVLTLPAVSDEKLTELMPIEARKYIPVPISEVFLDWQKIALSGDAPEAKEIKVLLFAIHKNAIEAHKSTIEKAALEATFYEMEIFSTLRSAVGMQTDAVVFADLGAGYTKLYIAKEGQIMATRKLASGGSELSLSISKVFGVPFEKAETLKKAVVIGSNKKGKLYETVETYYSEVFSEIEKMKGMYEQSSGEKIKRIVFGGGGSLALGLLEAATKTLGVECAKADPFSRLKTPAFFSRLLEETGPEFGVAVGLALRKLENREP
jgi:type IV pilus assembly protein PilM